MSAPNALDWHTWNNVDNRGEVEAFDTLGLHQKKTVKLDKLEEAVAEELFGTEMSMN